MLITITPTEPKAAGEPASGETQTLLHVLVGSERGGCERVSYFLCKYLNDGTRHEILVLGERGPMSADWERLGARVEHLDLMTAPRRERVRALRVALASRHSDGAMLWHGMAELPFLLHTLPRSVGPVLVHGGNPASDLSAWMDLRYVVAERVWPHVHDPLYVCCSQYVSDSFSHSRYLRRFRRCVVPNGVEHGDAFHHEPRPLPAAPDGEVVLGMVARLDSIKDHPTLLRALAEVARTVPGVRLELAGSGESEPALRALAGKLGLGERVRFLGMVRDVYGAMRNWDIFAYAATPQEGFGNAVAEALMCRLPVVVSDLAPLREVCGGAENVVYVAPGDPRAMAAALLRLIPDHEGRQRIGAAGGRHAHWELGAGMFAARYASRLQEERGRLLGVRGATR